MIQKLHSQVFPKENESVWPATPIGIGNVYVHRKICTQTAVYPNNGIPLSNKKEWTTGTCTSMDESQNSYAE